MHKFFLLILILAIFAVGYFYFKTTSFTIQVNSIKEEDKFIKISVEYPQFNQAPVDFNNKIKNLVTSKIAEFKKESNKNRQTRPETKDLWPLTIAWTPSQLNSKYISFVLRSESFIGGANMTDEIDTFNYDLLNKKDIKLDDLFVEKIDYLKIISGYVINDLTGKFKDSCKDDPECIPTEMINSGASAKEENFSKFTFTDNTVTFYFTKGEVAPAYTGEQTVIMPRNE